MRLLLPTHLRNYTQGQAEVEAQGTTLADVMTDAELRYPGLRNRVVDEQDRVRPHVKFFVGGEQVESLATPVGELEVQIVAALSGG